MQGEEEKKGYKLRHRGPSSASKSERISAQENSDDKAEKLWLGTLIYQQAANVYFISFGK